MAENPVNPERRDPGYFRKKADIGLSNVDNISATDFINTVSEDIIVLGNKKDIFELNITSGKEAYIAILETPKLSSHTIVNIGLYDNSNTELTQIHADFSFQTNSSSDDGSLNYIVHVSDNNPYLENLNLVFTQVGSNLILSLYSKSFPKSSNKYYFPKIGIRLSSWTEGTEVLNGDTTYKSIIEEGKELANLKLDRSYSSIESIYEDQLPVYDENGNRISLKSQRYLKSDIENLDCPTINNVPFIAKKGLIVDNSEFGRNITIYAKHEGSNRELAGEHDWDVLKTIKTTVYTRQPGKNFVGKPRVDTFLPTLIDLENTSDINYGLCKPTRYTTIPYTFNGDYYGSIDVANNWLNGLGDDSDVITVGSFRTFMSYFMSQVLGNITYRDKQTVTLYTDWNIKTETSNSEISAEEQDITIGASAFRSKYTFTYTAGELTSTEHEIEYAGKNDFTLVSDNGYRIKYSGYVTETGIHNWTATIEANKADKGGKRYFNVYVDKEKVSENSRVIGIDQRGYEPTISKTEITLNELIVPSYIPSNASEGFTIQASVNKKDTYTDTKGNIVKVTNTTITKGIEIKLYLKDTNTRVSESVEYTKKGNKFKVTLKDNYKINSGSSERTFTYTLSYGSVNFGGKTSIQAPEISNSTETLKSQFYVLCAENYYQEYESGAASEKFLLELYSYSASYYNNGNNLITESEVIVSSCPSWITNTRISHINEDKGKYFLYGDIKENSSFSNRTGEIILKQPITGNTITYHIKQLGKEAVLTGVDVKLDRLCIDAVTTIPKSGLVYKESPEVEYPKSVYACYKIYKTYSDNSTYVDYVDTINNGDTGNGITINVSAQSSGGSTATFSKRLNPDTKSCFININPCTNPATYTISAKYTYTEGEFSSTVVSPSVILVQGKNRISTEYIFESTYDQSSIISALPDGNIVVDVHSGILNRYDDGTYDEDTNNAIPFDINDIPKWVKVVSRSDNQIVLKVQENLGEYRTGILLLIQSGSNKGLSIRLSQNKGVVVNAIKIINIDKDYFDGQDYPLSFSNSDFNISRNLSPITITNGVSNTGLVSEIEISSPSSDWLSYSFQNGRLELKGKENTTGSERTGIIYATYKDATITISVKQEAGDPYIYINGDTTNSDYRFSKDNTAQDITFDISSNYTYTVSGVSNWATLVSEENKPYGDSQITISVIKNATNSTRVATFELKSDGGIVRRIIISQSPNQYYINVVNFENQDLQVSTHIWRPTVKIPIISNIPFMIDFCSDTFNAGLSTSSTFKDEIFSDDCTFKSGNANETTYLYISPVNSNKESIGTVSLSYFDSSTDTIISARKIHIQNITDETLIDAWGDYMEDYTILPYGPGNIFVSGEEGEFTIYAYTKTARLVPYVMEGGEFASYTSSEVSSTDLTSLTIKCGRRLNNPRKIKFAVGPEGEFSPVQLSKLPVYTVYQYPQNSLDIQVDGYSSGNVVLPYTGAENIRIVGINMGGDPSNHYELQNSSVPGWIQFNKIWGNEGEPIILRVDRNYSTEPREYTLKFWCKSDKTITKSVYIRQNGSQVNENNAGIDVDYSVMTASESNKYMYIYNASNVTLETGVTDSTNRTTGMEMINTTITRPSSDSFKIDYKISVKNQHVSKDFYKKITITPLTGGTNKVIYIINPRTEEPFITTSNSKITTMTNYSNCVQTFSLNTNIGLLGLVQSTNNSAETSLTCPSLTRDIEDPSVTYKGTCNLLNPGKTFLKKQVMDKILLTNFDLVPGYTGEVNVLLPSSATTSSNRGIEVLGLNGEELSKITDTTANKSISIYIPSNHLNSEGKPQISNIKIKAYDGVSITTTSSGKGFGLNSNINYAVRNAGSLGYQTLSLSVSSDNTGDTEELLGSIVLKLSNGITREILVYQSANLYELVGTSTILGVTSKGTNSTYTSDTASCIYNSASNSWEIDFAHQYQYWMILSKDDLTKAPTFNGEPYSSTYGNGGNSGIYTTTTVSSGNNKYRTFITLNSKDYSDYYPNETFEMKPITSLGIVSTYSTDKISNIENISSNINISSRPVTPIFSVYDSSNRLVKSSTGSTGNGTIIVSPEVIKTSTGTIARYRISFYVLSNYIDICNKYIGKYVEVMNGNVPVKKKINSNLDIFDILFKDIAFKYISNNTEKTCSVTPTITSTSTTIEGKKCALVTVTIDLTETISYGNIALTLSDFVINKNYYTPSDPAKISIDLTLL